MYYLAKVVFESENDNGKIKKIKEQYLVDAESVTQVEFKLKEKFEEGISEFKVASVNETQILGIIS